MRVSGYKENQEYYRKAQYILGKTLEGSEMSKQLEEIYGVERVFKIKTFLEMIAYTDELSKVNLEYLMDNAEALLYAIEQAERVQELEGQFYECPECGFEYHKQHEDDKSVGGYSCPACEELRLEQQNKRYREALEWIKELSEHNEYEDTLNQILLKAVEALEGVE